LYDLVSACGHLVLACEIRLLTRHWPLTPNLELIDKMIGGLWDETMRWGDWETLRVSDNGLGKSEHEVRERTEVWEGGCWIGGSTFTPFYSVLLRFTLVYSVLV
jgi:hypothetical protein